MKKAEKPMKVAVVGGGPPAWRPRAWPPSAVTT